jgi:hypothetical protein
MISYAVVCDLFARIGITCRKLREDRIYDEARHSGDPVLLMRLFGVSVQTAVRYVKAAHPAKSS